MSTDIENIDNKISDLRKKRKEKIKKAEALKIQALGAGIMKAVKNKELSWDVLRPALQKSVTKKTDRELLELGELVKELKPEPTTHPHHNYSGS